MARGSSEGIDVNVNDSPDAGGSEETVQTPWSAIIVHLHDDSGNQGETENGLEVGHQAIPAREPRPVNEQTTRWRHIGISEYLFKHYNSFRELWEWLFVGGLCATLQGVPGSTSQDSGLSPCQHTRSTDRGQAELPAFV